MTDNTLKAFFGWSHQKTGRRKRWFVESVQPKSIFVGFDDGKHYFRVEYIIKESQIIQRIDGSRNLKQSRSAIHKHVFVWLGRMESRIRENMGMFASLRTTVQ